jgi:hypothetical protein
MTHENSGFEALARTWHYLYVHLLILLAVTIIAAFISRLSAKKIARPAGEAGNPVRPPVFWSSMPYCGAFAMFGMATAYFLSLGLNATSGDTNSLLTSFTGPFIALLTAAVAYAASKTKDQIIGGEAGNNGLVLGIGAFLLTCILSYQTFDGQILHGVGQDPGGGGAPVHTQTGGDLPGPGAGHTAPPPPPPPEDHPARHSPDRLAPPQ